MPTVAATIGGAIVVAVLADTIATSAIGYLASGDAGTPEGFGAGSPIEDLIEELGAPRLASGECTLLMSFESRPGVGFVLELPPGSDIDCAEFDRIARDDDADRLPPGTMVRYLVQQRMREEG